MDKQLPYNEHWFYKHHKEIAKLHREKALRYAELIHLKSESCSPEELNELEFKKRIEIAKSDTIHIVLHTFMLKYCPLTQKIR